MYRSVAILLVAAATLLLPLERTHAARGPEEVVEILEGPDMSAWGYGPSTLTIVVGTTVTWRNTGREAHTVTSQDQLFHSKPLDPGKSFSYTFDTPGTYRYFCVPRPWMKGTVVVTPADESG